MPVMIRSILLSSRTAVVASTLVLAGSLQAQCTYSWPTTAFGPGLNDVANCSTVDCNGDLIVGGRFSTAGGGAAARIARWDGSAWSPLGTGMDFDVTALTTLANGDVLAAGSFITAGGVTVNGVARWHGSSWSALGTGLDAFAPFGPAANAVIEMPNGDIVVAGQFSGASGVAASHIARFDGSSWHALASGLNGPVRGLALAGSDLIAVGSFTMSGATLVNRVASWNGSSWSPLGSGLGIFSASAVAVSTTTGDIYVGGAFAAAGGVPVSNVARFAAGGWSALGAGTVGSVTSLHAMPNGDIMVGGAFTFAGGVGANRVARLSGSSWTTAFGAGANGTVQSLATAANGDVIVCGQFTAAGGSAQSRIARIISSCGPTVTALGPGCTGSGGLNVLTVTEAPTLGGAFRAKGTGMPAFAFVAAVTGLTSTSLPLSIVLPQALPGCTLYVTPDVIDVMLPAAGEVNSTLAVPVDPGLLNFVLNHQFVPLEVDASLMFTAVTASNGVQVSIGTF
ncbi:MAG: hypothetical protein ACJA0V_004748 [Planctomycetota bacterium]|jgi:hypothetical protein